MIFTPSLPETVSDEMAFLKAGSPSIPRISANFPRIATVAMSFRSTGRLSFTVANHAILEDYRFRFALGGALRRLCRPPLLGGMLQTSFRLEMM